MKFRNEAQYERCDQYDNGNIYWYQVSVNPPKWKMAAAEIPFIVLAVMATVETGLYAIGLLFSCLVYCYSDKPFNFCASLVKKSAFTLVWTLSDVFSNLFSPNLCMTKDEAQKNISAIKTKFLG